MNISFENPDKVNGVLKIVIEKEDYQPEVDKSLKEYRKNANVPGFRKGQAPMGLIKRQVGTQVKLDVVNKMLGDKLNDYIVENKIKMLGSPLPNEAQKEQDLESDGPFEFIFDIAVAPEMDVKLTDADEIDYYKIDVDDKLVDDQVEMFRSRMGHYDKVEEYDETTNDMLKGDLRELGEDGNAKEDGIVVEGASLMPQYIKVEEQKELFKGVKLGSVVTFNPKKAYPDSEAEITSLLKIDKDKAAELTSDFTFLVTEISHFAKADINQELFDGIYGEGTVKSEEEFRGEIKKGIETQLENDEDYKFLLDVRKYAEEKAGEVTFPEKLLRRIVEANNKDNKEITDEGFSESIKMLKWQLIRDQLLTANDVKIDSDDLRNMAKKVTRVQFAQYGMSNVPDEYIEQYSENLLKDKDSVDRLAERALDGKLTAALKKVVKLNEKTVSLDDFNKMMEEK